MLTLSDKLLHQNVVFGGLHTIIKSQHGQKQLKQ